MPEDIFLFTIDVVGLNLNIPHESGLCSITLDAQEGKTVSTDSFIESAECASKNVLFELNTSLYKQGRGTAIVTKMTPLYAIMFMGGLEE